MRSGLLIVVGIIGWMVVSLTSSSFFYQYNFHLIFGAITASGTFLWLRIKENRIRLQNEFSSGRNKHDNWKFEILLDSIRVGIIGIFALLTIGSETSKLIVRRSEGYFFIEDSISKNEIVQKRVGQVSFIAIRNNVHFSLSFEKDKKSLTTELLVFGSVGQVELEASATKESGLWTIDGIRFIE